MTKFFIVFLSLFGVVHAYIWFRFHLALRGHTPAQVAIAAALLVLMAIPFLTRVLSATAAPRWHGLLQFIGYMWMAWVLWFLFAGLLLDLYNGSLWLGKFSAPQVWRWHIPARAGLIAIGCWLLFATVWGAIEAQSIRLREIHLTTSRFAAGAAPLRVLMVTDVHFNEIRNIGLARKIVRLAERAQPDVIVSAGDMTDTSAESLRPVSSLLAGLSPPLGKFAIFGNHEFYHELRDSIEFHRAAGFRLLRGEAVTVGDRLLIAGVDDPAGDRRAASAENPAAPSALEQERRLAPLPADPARFRILLKHQPVVFDQPAAAFDLQLAGHTHKGQIFPFRWLVRLRYKFLNGLYPLPPLDPAAPPRQLYVSPGTGTWGMPLRLFSRPEVTLFIIAPAAPST